MSGQEKAKDKEKQCRQKIEVASKRNSKNKKTIVPLLKAGPCLSPLVRLW